MLLRIDPVPCQLAAGQTKADLVLAEAQLVAQQKAVATQQSAAMDKPLQEIVTEALARRPDMLSTYAAKQARFAKVRVARAEFMPKIFLSATGAYDSGRLDVTAISAIGQQQGTENLTGSQWSGIILAGITAPLL